MRRENEEFERRLRRELEEERRKLNDQGAEVGAAADNWVGCRFSVITVSLL